MYSYNLRTGRFTPVFASPAAILTWRSRKRLDSTVFPLAFVLPLPAIPQQLFHRQRKCTIMPEKHASYFRSHRVRERLQPLKGSTKLRPTRALSRRPKFTKKEMRFPRPAISANGLQNSSRLFRKGKMFARSVNLYTAASRCWTGMEPICRFRSSMMTTSTI